MSGTEKSFRVAKRRKKAYNALKTKQKQEVLNLIDKKMAVALEKKHVDVLSNGSVASGFTQTVDLTPIAQGISDTQRIGDQIDLCSIQGRYALSVGAGDGTNIMRVSVVQWLEDTSVTGTPIYGDILQYSTSPADIVSPWELDKNKRYRVLWDKLFTLVEGADTAVQIIEFYINKGFQKKIQYTNGATTGIGKIYLMFESDSVLASHPQLSGYSRVRYFDG